MKKLGYRILAVLLTLLMILSALGCGNQNDSEPEPGGTASSNGKVSFPLTEEMTFDIMVRYDGDLDAALNNCAFWNRLYEMTNVKINFIVLPTDGTMGAFNAMFAAKKEGDAILGGSMISESNLSLMAASGMLMPMNEYIDDPEIMPNFNSRVLAESPITKAYISMPDGNIYSLPKYTALDGSILESPLWINKVWLDQLHLPIPTTIEELEEVLVAFRDNDLNGNGDPNDEIPYIFLNGHTYSHMEAILGLWGLATKDSVYDSYVYMQDGKVQFAPTSEAYKDALTTLNRWYENDLIWSECFTGTDESFQSKISTDEPMVGLLTTKTLTAGYEDYFVQLEPVAVDGYEAKWYRHPGRLGGKGQFSLTRSCKNPEVLMHWIDLFYSFENSLSIFHGEKEDGRWAMTEDGKYEFITLPTSKTDQLHVTAPLFYDIFTNVPGALTTEDFQNRIILSSSYATYQQNYAIYETYMTDEFWPRPYIAGSDVSRLAELRTDIFHVVAEKREAWVTGIIDIEADWDDYQKLLDKIGIHEFLDISQRNYDDYLDRLAESMK